MIRIDGRIDGELKSAPLYAQALLVMLAEAIGPDRTKAAIDRLAIQNADFSLQVAGKPIATFIGLDRASLQRMGLNDDQIAEVIEAMRLIGRDVSRFMAPTVPDVIVEPVIPVPAPQIPPKPETKSEPSGADAEPPKTDASKAGINGTTVIAGHLVSELAGKPYKDLLAIEGIGPKVASKLSKLPAGTAAISE